MKKLTTILMILVAVSSYSQSRISVSAMQDARLAFLGDDKGNEAFTYNGNFRFNLEMPQRKHGYWSVGLGYEKADLIGGWYERMYAFVGYTFNNVGVDLDVRFLDYTEFSIDFNYGLTNRFGSGFSTRGLSGEIAQPIFKGVDFLLRGQFVQRPDLDPHPELSGKNYNGVIRFSGFVGFRLDISKVKLINW